MAVTVTHAFVSAVPDSDDTTLVRPSNWNADHTVVGLGTAAEADTADLLARANHTGTQLAATISDFSTAADLRIAGAVGVTVQAYSANLDEYAAVNPTAAGLALLDDASASDQRTTLGLGTAAVKNTGTSGDAIPLLNEGAAWNLGSGAMTFSRDGTQPTFNLRRTGTTAPGSFATVMNFQGPDIAGNVTTYAQFNIVMETDTDGAEDGQYRFTAIRAGTVANRMFIGSGVYHPSATGTDKGNNTINFGQLWYNGVQLSPPGSPVTKTADFTVAVGEQYLINNKAGSTCTVTLPSASSFPGRKLIIKNLQAQTVVSASSNVVPLTGGAASTPILSAFAGRWAKLVSDGTNWVIMEGVV